MTFNLVAYLPPFHSSILEPIVNAKIWILNWRYFEYLLFPVMQHTILSLEHQSSLKWLPVVFGLASWCTFVSGIASLTLSFGGLRKLLWTKTVFFFHPHQLSCRPLRMTLLKSLNHLTHKWEGGLIAGGTLKKQILLYINYHVHGFWKTSIVNLFLIDH